MALTQNDLDSFYDYASAAICVDDTGSLEELVIKWRSESSSGQRHEENINAIAAAIRDMDSGDMGRTAQESVQNLRAELRSLRLP
jgi:hypothetical protein